MIDIRKTMDSAGITQYKMAKLIDRHPQQIHQWYHGKRSISKLWQEKLESIFKQEGIEIVYL